MGNLKKLPSSRRRPGKSQPLPRKPTPVIGSRAIDRHVNALVCAYLRDLGLGGVMSPEAPDRSNQRKTLLELDPQQLVGVEFDGDPRVFSRLHSAAHVLDRYFYHEETGEDYQGKLQDEALNAFIDTAILGSDMNKRLVGPFTGNAFTRLVMNEASLICQRILGPLEAEDVFAEVGHGPNATTSLPRSHAYLDVKYGDFTGSESAREMFFGDYLLWDENLRQGLLEGLILLLSLGYEADWLESLGEGEVHEWSRLEFVDKKWNARRAITPQPTLNTMFQLGLGRVMQDRLKRAGICLSTQQQVHKHLVMLATRHPEVDIASVDWSEASNRLWLSIAERVFPADWYWWFTELRCPSAVHGDLRIELPFVGEMGNGFTFPFQTLLFYCVLRAVCEFGESAGLCTHSYVSVFGDDCLVPTGALPLIEHLAQDLGWKLNVSKTFGHGGFRESCGEDAFRGRSCRPFFIRRPADLCSADALRAWSYQVINGLQRVLRREGCPTTEVEEWLLKFNRAVGTKRIAVVPPRYPDTCGIQCTESELQTLSPQAYHIPRLIKRGDVVFPDDPGAFAFRCLVVRVGRRPPWWFPYYHLRLRGAHVPRGQDWLSLFPDGDIPPETAIDGVPVRARKVRYYELTRTTWTWDYWLPI